jgi:cysteine desulfurase
VVFPRYYLDYNATAPLRPEARDAMIHLLQTGVANPSGVHTESRQARNALDSARDTLAAVLGGRPSELIFTSGGTEANNLAILGLARAVRSAHGKTHLAVSAIEHHSILHAAHHLEREGFTLSLIPVDRRGRVLPSALAPLLSEDTALVAVMSANNETGVRQPIRELAELCRSRGILFHTDAVQSVGKEPVKVECWNVDSLALASHKFGGPLGAGALWIRAGLPLVPLLSGGSQENLRRAGTENVPAITGMVAAAQSAQADMEVDNAQHRKFIEALWDALQCRLAGLHRNGSGEDCLSNTLNVSVEGVHGEEMLIACDMEGLAVSGGAACMSGSLDASHVLLAMGVPDPLARAAVRFSIGHGTDLSSVETISERFATIVRRLRTS